MRRTMLKAKLHRVRVTHSELEYEGSIAIDDRLMDAADIREYERVEVYNITNGERFRTYAIRADRDSGTVAIMGAAAHKADVDDVIIICSYVVLEEKELAVFKPKLVYVDEHNRITHSRNFVPVGVG